MNIYRRPSWSDLPPELLQLIASRLETHEDVCQFCYVCNMWRQSAANLLTPLRLHSKLPYKFAVNIPFIHSNGPFIIVSSAVYILRRNTDEGHWKVIYWTNPNVESDSSPAEQSLLVLHRRGYLRCVRLLGANSYCETISYDRRNQFCDVVEWKGGVWAVSHTGRVYGIEYKTATVTTVLAASSNFNDSNERRKRLVESDRELYLVVRVHSPSKRRVKFEVYVLRCDVWEKVTSLGDRVLFVSFDSCFFAKASDLHPSGAFSKNCIVFPKHGFPVTYINPSPQDEYLFRYQRPDSWGLHYSLPRLEYFAIGIYNYGDSCNFKLLSSETAFSAVFWPPPPWVWKNVPPTSCRDDAKTNGVKALEEKKAKKREGEEKDNESAFPVTKKSRTPEYVQPGGSEDEVEGRNIVSIVSAPFEEVDKSYKLLNPLMAYYANNHACGKLKEASLEDDLAAFNKFCLQLVQDKSRDDTKKVLEMIRENDFHMVNSESQEEEAKKNKLDRS
uniref:F-box domain-containing protein n=1 Tax=Chenopodium quinoa TaxID=63459 RepID=A0A803MFS2_CHEQI